MKNKSLVAIAIAITTAFLAGCASPSLPGNYTLNPGGNKGVVVASITHNGTLGLHSINIRSGDGSVKERLAVGQLSIVPIPQKHDINESGVKGDVFSLELPQGSYEVVRWSVDSYSAHIGESTTIRFNVEPGKITYLGRFEFLQTGTNGVVVTRAMVSVKDESQKDMAVVTGRTPSLLNEPLSSNVSTSLAAQNVGKTQPATEYVPPFIMPPR